MKDILQRSPKLALTFTILSDRHQVRLIAGEDYRYTFSGKDIDQWLPLLLSKFNGTITVDQALKDIDEKYRNDAVKFITRLYGERILIDHLSLNSTSNNSYQIKLLGRGKLFDLLQTEIKQLAISTNKNSDFAKTINILCQDRLDYYELLNFNRAQLQQSNNFWLWASYGALSRAYVSQLCLTNAGPCLSCLINQFKRLSPMPNIYDHLIDQAKKGGEITPVDISEHPLAMLKHLVLWKLSLINSDNESPAAIFRLHVLEFDKLEITSHRVLIDPDCTECR